jgi:YggT family protein
MNQSAQDALIFIIHSFTQLYLLVLLVRLFMPWLNANFNNPLGQAIFRVTSPLIVPLRRVIPSIGRLDTATVIIAFAIEYLTVLVICAIRGWPLMMYAIAATAVVKLIVLSIWLVIVAILIYVVMSWLGGGGAYNPAMSIIHAIVDPALRPARRFIRPIGGLDLSAFVTTVALIALTILINGLRMLPV